jgi:hypothetical protein
MVAGRERERSHTTERIHSVVWRVAGYGTYLDLDPTVFPAWYDVSVGDAVPLRRRLRAGG